MGWKEAVVLQGQGFMVPYIDCYHCGWDQIYSVGYVVWNLYAEPSGVDLSLKG